MPVLWLYEASAVLAREQNRGVLAAQKADEFIAELQSLNITLDEASAARIFPDVHRLALAHRLTSYDAAYLEVALRRGLPLATLDDDLIRASRAAGVSVIALALGRQELASLFLQW
jgi:predicted nucleic acid-binding protein